MRKANEVTQGQMDAIAVLMDDEVRERVHRELAPCTPETFLKRYCELVPEFETVLNGEFSVEIDRVKGESNMKTIELLNKVVKLGFDRERALADIDASLDDVIGVDNRKPLAEEEISEELANDILFGFECETDKPKISDKVMDESFNKDFMIDSLPRRKGR